MSALKAMLLDRVKASGDLGVTTEELLADCYRDREPVVHTTIRVHMGQLNDLLEETDWHIYSDHRRWFIRREKRR
jgi:DNA-binding response OmpR family regulator